VIKLENSFPGGGHGGSHAFALTAAEPVEACRQDPVPADQVENCRRYPIFGVARSVLIGASLEIRFPADRIGRFKYFDPLYPSGYGVLDVQP
jgi:hypothetical protein